MADFGVVPAAEEILPCQRIGENQKCEQAEFFRHSGKFGKRPAPQTISRAEINQSEQRVEKHLPFRLAINQTAALIDFKPNQMPNASNSRTCCALERNSHGSAAMPIHQSRNAFGGRETML